LVCVSCGGKSRLNAISAATSATGSMTKGSNTAMPTIRRTDRRDIRTERDDSSTTGSSVQADMVQIASMSIPHNTAGTMGISNVVQNATAINRRSGFAGHTSSKSVPVLGRDARNTIAIGTDAYAIASMQ